MGKIWALFLQLLCVSAEADAETCSPSEVRTSALLQSKTLKKQLPTDVKVPTGVKEEAMTLPGQETLPGPYCVVAGDPHIKAFDRSEADEKCLGPMGDYWLVKTDALKIQARYMGANKQDGYSVIQGIVLTGSRLGSKTIHVPIINSGDITYDGKPVGDSFKNDLFSLEVKLGPKLVQFVEQPIVNAKKRHDTIFIRLMKDGKQDILVVINQGQIQHIMISATQTALAGTTGHCGNFNGDPSDDDLDVDKCSGRAAECLFPADLCPNPEDGQPRVAENCTKAESNFFDKICEANYPNPWSEWTIWNCKLDCCAMRTNCPDRDDNGDVSTCIVRGDPHVKTWDSSEMNRHVYTPLADHWLVNNKYLQIQGRYGSKRKDKKAQLFGVAISGPFMGKKS